LTALEQIAIGDPRRRVAADRDCAVGGRQSIGGHAEPRGRARQQRLARRCRRQRQVLVIEVRGRRPAPRGRPLIGRDRRVALDEPHAIERDAQLLGDQLHLRGLHALPEFALARAGRDAAIGGDGNPGIELPWVDGRRGGSSLRGRAGSQRAARREADDEDAGRAEEVAARHPGGGRCDVRVARHAPSAS
jgi:hypothetical protein